MPNLFAHGLTGIIYDCDGVMIDSESANRYFYNTILQALGLPELTGEQEKYAFMATAQQVFAALVPPALLPGVPETIQKVIHYQDVLARTKLVPGFRNFVEDAHAHGLRQAIDTNRTHEGIQRVLDFFGLPNYFDPVINVSMAEPKPAPQGPRLICQAWNCRPDTTLFIGDSPSDGEAARSAGAVFAAFGKPALQGDIRVSGYPQLAAMLWG